MSIQNRRVYRRLDVNVPLRCTVHDRQVTVSWQAVSKNVSTSGIYFETTMTQLAVGQTITLELFIPPGIGHFPYESRAVSKSKIVRMDILDTDAAQPGTPRRIGIAAKFLTQLKMEL